MRYLISLFATLALACAAPETDGSGTVQVEMDQGLERADGGMGMDGTGGSEGTPPGNAPDGEFGGTESDEGMDGRGPDAGFDGLDGGLGNQPMDRGLVGGGRGDDCADGVPSLIEIGQGAVFETLLDGDVLPIFLGSDGGAVVELSVRLDQFTDGQNSTVELIDDGTGEILGSMSPIGAISCVDGHGMISGALLPISPAFDPFLLIDQTATLRVDFSTDRNDMEIQAQIEVSVMLELATD